MTNTIGTALFISLLYKPKGFTLSKAFDKSKAHKLTVHGATSDEVIYRLPNIVDGISHHIINRLSDMTKNMLYH